MHPAIKAGILVSAIAAATVTAFAPIHAAPLPLDASYFADGDDIGVVKDINMNIPVGDTTRPVNGGVVRYYGELGVGNLLAGRGRAIFFGGDGADDTVRWLNA